ncbi:MAG: sulfotransferase family protein, partial [Woeseiaceae bacterium]
MRFNVDCGRRIVPTERNFIVIGAMKAGTTTLFELLAQHPALCRTWAQTPGFSFTKEINYFRYLYRKSNTPLHYDWRFPFDPAQHDWTLEASPNYAKWPGSQGVPRRIASLGGETKLAYILREPVDRIESHLAHKLRGGKNRHLRQCIRTSRYAMQLDKFTAHFARDDILLLDFEQLRRDPSVILAQVCDFLGIHRFAPAAVVHNRRSIEFRLDAKQRAELAQILRP